MKLRKILPLFLVALLAGCEKKGTNNVDLTILSPTGAPAVAFYNYADNKNYTTNAAPNNIVASMTKNGTDIVVIDTLSGLKAIKNAKAPYKLLATITFGNFYLAGTGHDDNGVIDANDRIVLFGQGQTPDKLFNYLYPSFTNVSYVTNVQEAGTCLCSGKTLDTSADVDYVFIAEPLLTNIVANAQCNTYMKTTITDVQALYKEKSGDKLLTQASVFVKNGSNKEAIYKFADSLKQDIETAIVTPQVIVEGMSKITAQEAAAKYGIGAAIAKSVMENANHLGLGFEFAIDIKDDIDAFISLFGEEASLATYYYAKKQ